MVAAILHKEKYEMYQVNVLICWISPLNQAVYGKHNLAMIHYFRPSGSPVCSSQVFYLFLWFWHFAG